MRGLRAACAPYRRPIPSSDLRPAPPSAAGVGRSDPRSWCRWLVGGSVMLVDAAQRQTDAAPGDGARQVEPRSPPVANPLLAPLLGDSADPGAGPDSAPPTDKERKNPPTADRRSRARLPVGDASAQARAVPHPAVWDVRRGARQSAGDGRLLLDLVECPRTSA